MKFYFVKSPIARIFNCSNSNSDFQAVFSFSPLWFFLSKFKSLEVIYGAFLVCLTSAGVGGGTWPECDSSERPSWLKLSSITRFRRATSRRHRAVPRHLRAAARVFLAAVAIAPRRRPLRIRTGPMPLPLRLTLTSGTQPPPQLTSPPPRF